MNQKGSEEDRTVLTQPQRDTSEEQRDTGDPCEGGRAGSQEANFTEKGNGDISSQTRKNLVRGEGGQAELDLGVHLCPMRVITFPSWCLMEGERSCRFRTGQRLRQREFRKKKWRQRVASIDVRTAEFSGDGLAVT